MRTSKLVAASLLVGMAVGCTGVATVTDPLRPAGAPRASAVPSAALEEPVALETHEGLAWMLTKSGALVSLTHDGGRMVRHLAQDAVLGLHRSPDARLWALTRDTETDDLRLWVHDAMTWSVVAEWMGMGEPPLALTSSGSRPVVISPAAAFVLEGDDLRGVELVGSVGAPGDAALAAATKSGTAYVYERVAQDAGYLNAIDLETGDVGSIVCPASSSFSVVGASGERRPCAGITGIVADPEASDCVLVSFRQRVNGGFLWRVCDDRAQIVQGPWEDLGFEEDPARALAPFGHAAEPENGPSPRAAASVALLGMAPVDGGVWIATSDALVSWRPGAAPRFVLRSSNWKPTGPKEERRDLMTFAGKTHTLLAAESAAAPAVADEGPPPAACYRATNGDALCLQGNRFRHKSQVADDTGSVLIRPLGDGSYAADVDGGERLTMHFASDRALVLRKVGERRVGARLARLEDVEARALLEVDE